MTNEMLGFTIIAVTFLIGDGLLYLLIRTIGGSRSAQSITGLPILFAAGLMAFVIAAHFLTAVAAYVAVKQIAGWSFTDSQVMITGMFVVCGMFLASASAVVFIESVGTRVAAFIFGGKHDGKPELDLSEARRHLIAGSVDAALAEYRKAAKQFPENPEPLFLQMALYENNGQFNEAVETGREITRRFKSDVVTWTKAARGIETLLRERLNDTEAADYLARTILERNPDQKFNYVFTEKKKTEGFRMESDKRVHGIADLDQARRLAYSGETDKAVELFRRCFEAHPEEARPLFAAASALSTAQRYEDAKNLLQEIVQKFRKNDDVRGEAMLRIATLYQHHLGDVEVARGILKSVIEMGAMTKHGRAAAEQLRSMAPPAS